MPGPTPDAVTSDQTLPDKVDVAIIGGGIAGASAALELSERGYKVALFEKGNVGAEQSSRNWGWVRITHRDPREMPLMVESARLWEGLDKRLGESTGYKKCGITFSCTTDEDMAEMEHWLGYLKEYQLPASMMSAKDALAAFPGMNVNIKGALVSNCDGRAEPQKAAPAIARAAQRLGAKIFTQCAVRTIERNAGSVSAVVTEKGRVACNAVLLAGGAWSRMFLHNIGIFLPQLRMKNTVLRTNALEGGPDGTFKHTDFTMRKRLDGGYTVASVLSNKYQITPDSFRLMKAFAPAIKNEWKNLRFGVSPDFLSDLFAKRRWGANDVTPFEQTRILDPEPEIKAVDRLLENIRKVYPVFKDATISQRWAGMIDVVPDAIPVISAVDAVPGLFLSTGYSGHGFGLGPGAGRLIADLITNSAPMIDPHPFRLARFTDGSEIKPISGVARR